MAINHFLAIDLGAESGRAVAGILEKAKLFLDEVHRFPTTMLPIDGHYYWNVYRFYEEIIRGLDICTNKEKITPESLAIDTWGVDFGLLASDGTLNRIPYAYRDPQTAAGMDHFLQNKMDAESVYKKTGIALQPFNSLFHLYALRISNDPALVHASDLLFLPDLLNYFLTGIKRTEFTFATTSQLYNPLKAVWEQSLFNTINVPVNIMQEIIQPGTRLGILKPDVARQASIDPLPVISVCSHDTGSAIVAVPAEGDDWAYISSGTWSLMGIENAGPIINSKSFAYNFTNEGGALGTFRFLKNIMGLWLLQQCRKSWSTSGQMINYSDLVEMANLAKPFRAFIDPDDMGFYNPADMPLAIDSYCEKTGQESPGNIGEYVRTILESLAFKYRMVLDQLTEVSGRKINKIHIIGGGSQNKLLCQYTANVTGLKVITGPAEGTAAGNILMQAYTLGYLSSLEEIRRVVHSSFELETFTPQKTSEWESAYQKYLNITCRK